MRSHLRDAVEIELVIEGSRNELYEKITVAGCSNPGPQFEFSCPEFLVQNIYPKDDKLVFQVKYGNNYLYYYAFKFKEFIICPAFLGEFFGLGDYSYLVVEKDCKYYYIFLDSGYDDYFSLISKYSSDLLHLFHLILPKDQRKTLTLNSKNKDIRSLIDESNLSIFPFRFAMGAGAFSSGYHSSTLGTSSINPEYMFVSRNDIDKLVGKYGKLFSNFNLIDLAIIHRDSATAKKVQEFIQTPNDKKRSYHVAKSNTDANKGIPYLRESYLTEKLINHIRINYEEGRILGIKKFFSCIFHIFQSTGYGKSKLIEHLGKEVPTFYSSFQKDFGYPKVSILLVMLIEKLEYIISITSTNKGIRSGTCFINNITTASYIYILRVMYIILTEKKKMNQKLNKALNIDTELINATIFPGLKSNSEKSSEIIFEVLFKNLERLCYHKQSIVFDGKDPISLNNLKFTEREEQLQFTLPFELNKFSIKDNVVSSDFLQTDNLENDVIDLLEEFRIHKDLPFAFVIDDAQDLLYRMQDNTPYRWMMRDIGPNECSSQFSDTEQSPYNIFQRVFRIFSNPWERLMLITVGKCEKIIDNKSKTKEDWESPVIFMNDFFLTQTFNVNSKIAEEIEADMFQKRSYSLMDKNPIKDWNEFLDSNFRIIEYFKFGRPLSYGKFKEYEEKNVESGRYNLKETLKNCCEFQFKENKLSVLSDSLQTLDVTCLYSIFNFAFGARFLPVRRGVPMAQWASELAITSKTCVRHSPGASLRTA
jgi:hypothetical protein